MTSHEPQAVYPKLQTGLVRHFLALLSHSSLAVHVELSGGGVCVVLAVRLHVLDELSDTEKVVHTLERHSLGLRYEEPHEDEHGEAESSVDEEGTRTSQHSSGHGEDENKTYP